jgi:hypothetical protein
MAAVRPELIVTLGFLGALVLGLGVYFGYQRARRWREDACYRKAQISSASGDSRAALRWLMKAQAAWRLHSSAHAVRFYGDDLDRLVTMHRMIRREMAALGTGLDLYDLEAAARGMKRLAADGANFTWDNRTMKPDTALSWTAYLKQLDEARRLIQAMCEQTLRRD